MTKPEIKMICEDDPQMQWWAMVLFAEISDLVHYIELHNEPFDDAVKNIICRKIKEFKDLFLAHQIKKIKDKNDN